MISNTKNFFISLGVLVAIVLGLYETATIKAEHGRLRHGRQLSSVLPIRGRFLRPGRSSGRGGGSSSGSGGGSSSGTGSGGSSSGSGGGGGGGGGSGCLPRSTPCDPDRGPDCCGNGDSLNCSIPPMYDFPTDEFLVSPYHICCLLPGEQGCDSETNNICCLGLCNVNTSTCCFETEAALCTNDAGTDEDICYVKGENCTHNETTNTSDCCGNLICHEDYSFCCLAGGVQGCDNNETNYCCSGICNVTTSTCCNEDDTSCFNDGGNDMNDTCFNKLENCSIIDATTNASDCCGGLLCQEIPLHTYQKVCCLNDTEQGCDNTTMTCCSGYCDLETSTCCAEGDLSCYDGGRPLDCRIHGEPCVVDLTDPLNNTCCGEMKYRCEITSKNLTQETCCIPVGDLGCGEDGHCCGSAENITFCLGSRCAWTSNSSWPDDDGGAEGDPDCQNKGGNCTNITDCCGWDSPDARVGCEYTIFSEFEQQKSCCLVSGVQGCEYDYNCCDGHCEVNASLCCIPLNDPSFYGLCNTTEECCSGYCNDHTCECVPQGGNCTKEEDCCSDLQCGLVVGQVLFDKCAPPEV